MVGKSKVIAFCILNYFKDILSSELVHFIFVVLYTSHVILTSIFSSRNNVNEQ